MSLVRYDEGLAQRWRFAIYAWDRQSAAQVALSGCYDVDQRMAQHSSFVKNAWDHL